MRQAEARMTKRVLPAMAGGNRALADEIARWPTLRDQFPLPAERGEGQGEGCLGSTISFSGNVFKAFPSPRPSPRSFLAGRGRSRRVSCSPCLCRLSRGFVCKARNGQTRCGLVAGVLGNRSLAHLAAWFWGFGSSDL